jgi:hypothetical protein
VGTRTIYNKVAEKLIHFHKFPNKMRFCDNYLDTMLWNINVSRQSATENEPSIGNFNKPRTGNICYNLGMLSVKKEFTQFITIRFYFCFMGVITAPPLTELWHI